MIPGLKDAISQYTDIQLVGLVLFQINKLIKITLSTNAISQSKNILYQCFLFLLLLMRNLEKLTVVTLQIMALIIT